MANKPATIPRVTAVSHSIVSLDPICGTTPAAVPSARRLASQLTAFDLNCLKGGSRALRPPDAAPNRCGKARPRPACLTGRRGDLETAYRGGHSDRVGNPMAAASFIEIADAAEREYLRRSPAAPICQLGCRGQPSRRNCGLPEAAAPAILTKPKNPAPTIRLVFNGSLGNGRNPVAERLPEAPAFHASAARAPLRRELAPSCPEPRPRPGRVAEARPAADAQPWICRNNHGLIARFD